MASFLGKKGQMGGMAGGADTTQIAQVILIVVTLAVVFSVCIIALTNLQSGIVTASDYTQYTEQDVVLAGGSVTLSRSQCSSIDAITPS